MFKKLMSFILEDEEEIVEEDLNEITQQEEPIVIRRSLVEKETKIESHQLVETPDVLLNKNPSRMIDVDDLPRPATHIKKIKAEKNPEYEFSPVISPMFGVSQAESESFSTVIPIKLKTQSVIGTIISPIYGVDKENEPENMRSINMPLSNQENDEGVNLSLDEVLLMDTTSQHEQQLDEIDAFLYDETSELLESDKRVISSHNLSLFDDIEQ